MNREPNNNIDILLRKLGRRQNGSLDSSGGDQHEVTSEHLDADELNAYAERALPASVRARYTEHLADCNACRQIVTQLSFSSVPVAVHEHTDHPSSSGWKNALAMLFSPFVIRYAVPTMAVVMLAAIAWIVVSRRPALEQIASNTGKQAQAEQEAQPVAEKALPTRANTQQPKQSIAPEQPTASPHEERSSERPAKAVGEIRETEEVAKRDQPPAKAPAPPAATTGTVAARPTASDVERNRTEVQKKTEGQVAAARQPIQQESRTYDSTRSGPAQTQQAPREAPAQRTAQATRELGRQDLARDEAKEKDQAGDDGADVRTIAGRRFTRRGSLWIDSAYRDGQATVSVTRGSEQFRALIGDEPGLKTIVEQLSGDVIVVWKGRAYRFR